jgi:hypothetical protein
MNLSLGFGLDKYRVQNGTLLNPLPASNLVTLWLDGTIIDVSGSKYFVDKKSGNNVLITGYDFPTGWVKGFPYKSAATIDIFGQTGVPVVSLFQDIDYGHQYFCRHVAQVVDGNGVETSKGYVAEIVAYSTPLTGGDLTSANTYYGVPVEQTDANAVWLSPTGNDATGAGTKASPYRSLDKVKATTKTYIYLKSGDYDLTSYSIFTGGGLTLQGLGKSSFELFTNSFGLRIDRVMTISNCIIKNTNTSTYGIGVVKNLTLNLCKLSKAAGSGLLTSQAVGLDVIVRHCHGVISTTYGLFYDNQVFNNAFIDSSVITSTYTKLTGSSNSRISGNIEAYAAGNGSLINLTNGGNVTKKFLAIKNCTLTGTVDVTAVNNFKFQNNSVINSTLNTRICRIGAAAGSGLTGVEATNNTIIGNATSGHLFSIGDPLSETSQNSMNGVKVIGNYIENTNMSASGTCHTLFMGSGIDPMVKYNKFIVKNGYALVIKSGGLSCLTTDSHVSYNVFDCQSTPSQLRLIFGRGCFGLIVANNTILGHKGGEICSTDDNGSGFNNSVLFINNNVTLGGTTIILAAGTNMTSRNNVVNKLGFTLTGALGANDFLSSVAVDSNGVPESKIEHAETVATSSNNQGLAVGYSIPDAITYQNQAATWQNGAVILP